MAMEKKHAIRLFILSLVICICHVNHLKAGNQPEEIFILENKGQVDGSSTIAGNEILYYAKSENFVCYITKSGVYYQIIGNNQKAINFLKEEIEKTNDIFTFKLEFAGQNHDPEIISGKVNSYYEIHYLQSDEIIANSYSSVTLRNLYPNIDCKYYIENGNLKYDFIINEGGNATDLKIVYKGITGVVKQNENKLNIITAAGSIIENIPVSYYLENNQKLFVECNYLVSGDTVAFEMNEKQQNKKLIIDPVLNWEATIGSSATDVYGTTVDKAGNIYVSGQTSALTGIAYLGFQNTKSTGIDGFLAKYNAAGVKLWATYYGNTGNDKAFCVTTDNSANVYIAGSTTSSTGIASGGYQNVLGGLSDGFITKFNSTGARLWSTYFGGTGDEAINGMAINSSSELVIGGTTSSSAAIASGGYKLTYSGNTDCFIAKFNLSGSIIWSTYYGGTGAESDGAVTFDKWGNIYIVGTTSSTTGIAYSGLVNTYQGGIDDGFYAKFDGSGSLIFASYLGGANSDYSESCITDTLGNLYIAGTTVSSTGIALLGHQNTHGTGYWDAYLIKFDPDGNKLWGTYYGGNDFDLGAGVTCDMNNNVFLCGKTVSTNNIANGGYLFSYPGAAESYTSFLAKFDSNGTLNWGTYYGTSNPNYGEDVCTDTIGNVYLGAYFFSNGGRLIQYQNINYKINIKNITDTVYCQGDKLYVKYDAYGIYNAGNYFIAQLSDAFGSFDTPINLGENHISNHGTVVSFLPYELEPSSEYRIRVISTDPYYESVQSLESLEILPSPVVAIAAPPVLTACSGDGILLVADSLPGLNYKWFKNGTYIPGATNNSYLVTTSGNYFVKVKNLLCDYKSEQYTVTIIPSSVVNLDASFCEGNSFVLPDGITVYEPGDYISVIPGVFECDSIINTTLSYSPGIVIETYAVNCSGTEYFLPDGIIVTTSGVYSTTLLTDEGCDSTIITNLTNLATYNVLSNIDICNGDSVLLTDGYYASESGEYTDTYEAGGVCIAFTTNLNVAPDYSITEYIMITEGDIYTLPGGGEVSVSGIYIDSLVSDFGCDSIIITNLSVVPDGCNPPLGITVTGITATSATVNWVAAFEATKYDIYYRVLGLTEWQKKSSLSINKTLTGLSPGTTYEYKVRTVCGVENSVFSSIETFVTLPLKNGEIENDIHVFPTVNSGNFSIDLSVYLNTDIAYVNCYNVAGQLIYNSIQKCGDIVSIDLNDVAAGPVLIEVVNLNKVTKKWIIIQ